MTGGRSNARMDGPGGNTPVFGRNGRDGTPRTRSGICESRDRDAPQRVPPEPRRLFDHSTVDSIPDDCEAPLGAAPTPQSTPEGTYRSVHLQRQTGRLLQSTERLQERRTCRSALTNSTRGQANHTASPRRNPGCRDAAKKENRSPRKNENTRSSDLLENEVKDLRKENESFRKQSEDFRKQSEEIEGLRKENAGLRREFAFMKKQQETLMELIQTKQAFLHPADREWTDQSERPPQQSGSAPASHSSACSTPRSCGRVRVHPPAATSHPSIGCTHHSHPGSLHRPYPGTQVPMPMPTMGSHCVMRPPTRRTPTPTASPRLVHKSASPTRTPMGRMQVSPRLARMSPARSASAGTWESGDVEEGRRAFYPRNDRAQPSYEGAGVANWRRHSPSQRCAT
mmetsp:Transcript_26418/g.48335  ORF Transcript_26418/g.48335 Transcript_26418/m.48335 type:complete len:398 (-) Transcript_26418:105-1298(-)